MHVHSPIFQGQLKEKKIRPITLKVWVLRRVKKPKKGSKKFKISHNFLMTKASDLKIFLKSP